MKQFFCLRFLLMTCSCIAMLLLLAACGQEGLKPSLLSNSVADTANVAGQNVSAGPQPCPDKVKAPGYWNKLVGVQAGKNHVERVQCAHVLGNTSLQALVTVRSNDAKATLDAYVYTDITSAHPSRLFSLIGLRAGDARFSPYNTVISAEINRKTSPLASSPDLFREFKWSEAAGTLVPFAFPGLYPDMTRYQAESSQVTASSAANSWRKDASAVAKALAVKMLLWSSDAETTIISGGGTQDVNATIRVKGTTPGVGAIVVKLSRLEGNSKDGIWEVLSVSSQGMSLAFSGRTSPLSVTGTGNAFEAVIGPLLVLDSHYKTIGKTTATTTGSNGMGNGPFTATVTFDASVQSARWNGTSGTGPQEGIVVLETANNAGGPPSGAVMVKTLLGN